MTKCKCKNFDLKVYEIVRRIPRGRVTTYGYVAKCAGSTGAAQSVGNALARAKEHHEKIPWYRVVKVGGKISLGAPGSQADLLRKEHVGVEGPNGKFSVDLWKYGWCRE